MDWTTLLTLRPGPWPVFQRRLACGLYVFRYNIYLSWVSLSLIRTKEFVSNHHTSSISSKSSFIIGLRSLSSSFTMAPNLTQSSTRSTLQVPGRLCSRILRPPSPSRTQPGFVATPSDSRTSLSVSSAAGDGSPVCLAHCPASPRPPPPTKQKNMAPKVKPTPKGKVSLHVLIVWYQFKLWNWSLNPSTLLESIFCQQTG